MMETETIFAAVTRGDTEAVRTMIARDPSLVNARDAEGATPLHLAAVEGHCEIALLLIEHGAHVNATDHRFGATPAGWAIEYLRPAGALLAMEIADMRHAVTTGNAEWVERMIRRLPTFASCVLPDGEPLYDYALRVGTPKIQDLFRSAKATVASSQ